MVFDKNTSQQPQAKKKKLFAKRTYFICLNIGPNFNTYRYAAWKEKENSDTCIQSAYFSPTVTLSLYKK